MHRAADVHGGENREDEGLQYGDEDLESVERHQERTRQQPAHIGRREERGREDGEDGEQQVTSKHVGEEPD